jgi:hypothetical protein
LPPLPPPAEDGERSTISFGSERDIDWTRLLRGNWLGAAVVAGVTLAVAGVLAVVMVALAKPEDFGVDNSLTFVALVLNGSFGSALVVRVHISGESLRGSVGFVPLTVTVLALLAGTLAFRRMTKGYRRPLDAIADAARAALMLALALMVIALVFRSDTREFGRGWGNELAHLFEARLAYGPSIPGSFIGGFVFLFVPLAATVWVRRDLWPERHRRYREFLVPPLYGLGSFALLLPVAGLVGLVLMMFTGDTIQDTDTTTHDFLASAVLIFGLLASGGYWLVNIGLGGSLGAHGSDGSTTSSDYHHLAFFAGEDWGLWAAPVVAVVVIAVATVIVARRTPDDNALPASLVSWVALLLVTTPAFVWLTSVHGKVTANDGQGSGAEGVHGWWAALLIPLVALVCSAVVAQTRGVLDVERLRTIGRGLQSNPGRSSAED